MVEDAASSLFWLHDNIHPDTRIIIWGHSLGTGVTCRLGSNLKSSKRQPIGYVLEAPFNSMDSITTLLRESGSGWFGLIIGTINKIFDYFADTKWLLQKRDLLFDSEKHLLDINEKVCILHAKDDAIVPFQLGERLYKKMAENSKAIKFFPFNAEHNLGHDDIYKYNDLDKIMQYISTLY